VIDGKRTAIAALILAVYGALKAFGVVKGDLPEGTTEVVTAALFFVLRLVTTGPHTIPGVPTAPTKDIAPPVPSPAAPASMEAPKP